MRVNMVYVVCIHIKKKEERWGRGLKENDEGVNSTVI
jgi:hypothetical protein